MLQLIDLVCERRECITITVSRKVAMAIQIKLYIDNTFGYTGKVNRNSLIAQFNRFRKAAIVFADITHLLFSVRNGRCG